MIAPVIPAYKPTADQAEIQTILQRLTGLGVKVEENPNVPGMVNYMFRCAYSDKDLSPERKETEQRQFYNYLKHFLFEIGGGRPDELALLPVNPKTGCATLQFADGLGFPSDHALSDARGIESKALGFILNFMNKPLAFGHETLALVAKYQADMRVGKSFKDGHGALLGR